MGFNSAFKGLKIVKNPGNGRLNNLNDPILNVLIKHKVVVFDEVYILFHFNIILNTMGCPLLKKKKEN